jgi:hypothetical protein
MKSVIMNLQHQEPQRSARRSVTPPTHQSKRSVGFVDQFNQHNNPPPMVFVNLNLHSLFWI